MVVITGGGTGGHLAVAKAVASELENFIYIGSTRGQDSEWFSGQNCYFLKSSGFVNQGALGKIKVLFSLISLVYQCIKIFKKHKISCVFSVGGYSSVPASIAALLCFKPLIIHEQNSKMGLANRLMKPFAKRFFSAYEEEFCAYPVRESFSQIKRERKQLNTLLILGGSQGARFLNDFAIALYPELLKRGIKLIHQCGKNDLNRCTKAYEDFEQKPVLLGFTDKIEHNMSEADFAISRAGASASFELINAAVPTLFVPYPYAYKNHQYFNALFLVKNELAFLCEERNLNPEIVLELLDTNALKYAQNLYKYESKNGAKYLASVLKGY